MLRNAFIDLGSFRGDIIRRYIKSPLFSSSDIIHAFEPNPLVKAVIFAAYPPGVIIHREAVWIEDGELDLFLNKDGRQDVQGSSICRGKITGDLDFERPVKVKCIDFSKFLCLIYDQIDGGKIRVKMNIEGAEYPLLEKMCADGSVRVINTLYLRVHWHKIGIPEERNTALLSRLSELGVDVKREYFFV
jgi:hypothetical protein